MTVKRPHGTRTAERLLDAALAVHASAGFEGLTVQAVLDRSGASLGSLYHHFGSAAGLQAALYARSLRRLLDAVADAVATTATARDGVHALVVAYLGFTAEQPDVARFVHAASYAPFLSGAAADVAATVEPALERLRAQFRPHLASGELAPLPEPLVEMLLVGPPAETARRWLAGDLRIDLETAVEVLPDRVWESVRGRA